MTYYYHSGENVKIGDIISYKRRFRIAIKGEVKWMYDPSKPSPPRGGNDEGYGIELENSHFIHGLEPDPNIKLISRKKNSAHSNP